MDWEVAVIGAGAAGLLAAARAAERGRRTLLLEKNRKPGAKILMSGGTRCNLTQNSDARGIIEAFGPPGRFLHSALAALGPSELIELMAAEGVATKVEPTGKVFPRSNKAADVLAALMDRLRRIGCTLALGEPLESVQRVEGGGFQLVTARRTLTAEHVVLTTGGQSYPGCGTTGDGYRWLAELGHTIVAPRPALVPITTRSGWVATLQGVTIADAHVSVVEPNSDTAARPVVLARRRGSLLFTHFGLSGPAALDVSRAISGHPNPRTLALVCDFLPGTDEAALEAHLAREATAAGRKKLPNLLPAEIPARLAAVLVELAGLDVESKAAELSKPARRRLVDALKRLPISIEGTRGFKKAEVTAGGVALDEIDSHTMQSKLVPGLFLAGEILDLDGPIGGYNFQAAFSTGWLAGENV